MTFLQYVLGQHLGPPNRMGAPGESYWDCPQCDHHSFHSMPTKKQYKERARCFRCPFRGDVEDMLKEFHPDETHRERNHRLHVLWDEFHQATPGASPSSPGVGAFGEPDDACPVVAAFYEFLNSLRSYRPDLDLESALFGFVHGSAVAAGRDVDPYEMATFSKFIKLNKANRLRGSYRR